VTPARRRPLLAVAAALHAGLLAAACAAGPTPPASLVPGTVAAPREINVIASDYAFVPAVVRVVPGETVLVHVVNGGLEPHEAVIGDAPVQLAWEAAHARNADAPPGPTPVTSVPPAVAGVRVFVASGQRADVTWTVPADAPIGGLGASGTSAAGSAAPGAGGWLVGCHIPGHFARGMLVPVEFVTANALRGSG